MHYVSMQDCKESLFQLAIEFDASQKTPDYQSNPIAMQKLEGVLQHAQTHWYPTLLKKASYLFVSVNKGHFFLNGNKRLSLLITLDLLHENGIRMHRPITKKVYMSWFRKNFPDYKLKKDKFRTIYGWAFYNLSKAVAADENGDFDRLKNVVESFISLSMYV